MKTKFFLVLGLILLSSQVLGLSCQPLTDRIIAECSFGTCAQVLFIKEVPTSGACSRRPKVEKTPEWVKGVLDFEIAKLETDKDELIYQLELSRRYWSSEYVFANAAEYIDIVQENTGGKLIDRELNQITDETFNQIETRWKSRAQEGYLWMVLSKVIDWLALLVSLVFLVLSILWFNQFIAGRKSLKWVFLPLLAQIGVVFVALSSLSSWNPYLICITALFIPGIWFYEAVYFLNIKLKRK